MHRVVKIAGETQTPALRPRPQRAIDARKVLVIFDCCHSGGIGQPKDATAPLVKVEGARQLGAEVQFAGTTSIDRKIAAETLADLSIPMKQMA